MTIGKPNIRQEADAVVVTFPVQSINLPDALWYSLNGDFSDLVSDSCDAPLVALLIPAMASGENIYVDGSISEKLYYNLSGPYQALLQRIIPRLRRVAIRANEVTAPSRRAPGVATGFSGGVDSYYTLATHYYDADLPATFKLTHLLFNNVGSHGHDGDRLFRRRLGRLEQAAERIGLPIVAVNSNLDAFYKEDLGFQLTHTPRNASVAHLVKNGIGRYVYSSTFSLEDVFVGPTHDIAHADPISLPLLGSEELDALSVGAGHTRVEKTLAIAELPVSHATLDVCINGHYSGDYANCATCWKCVRTLLTLEIAGKSRLYSEAFDLDAFGRERIRCIGNLLARRDRLSKEVVRFAAAEGYSFPIGARVWSLLLRTSQTFRHVLSRVARRLTT